MAEGFDPSEFAAFKAAPPAFDPAEFAAVKAGAVDVGGSIAAGQITHGAAAPEAPRTSPPAPLSAIPGGEGMTFPTAPGPSATARRMGEGAAAGFGDRPLGIAPADRAAYPIARALQPIAAPADFLARSLAAGLHGAAGAAAGAYEDLGGSAASADRLQRDLGILTQFPGEPGMSPAAVPPRVGLPRVEPVAPSAQPFARPPTPAPSLATERPNTGVRLLPPEIPHAYTAPRPSREDAALGADAAAMRDSLTGDMSARRSAGAAGTPGTGPLAEISPAAVDKLKAVFAEEGFTPATLEQRLEEMSSHEYLGEISPNTALHMSALNGTGGAARNEITNSVRQRSREAGERMESAFDRAFGQYENRHQIQRSMEISRDQQVQPFWQRFREMTVEPTPAIEALMPRLEAAGALQSANRALAVEGLPSRMGFQQLGTGTYIRDTPQFMTGLPAVRKEVPTAAAFQAAKEHLDDLIERSMGMEGGANDARRYTALKNDLINALDQHPDPEVAGVWRRARDEYATPTSIIKAMKTGERALTGNITAEELPFLTASYSPAELRAFNVGIRGRLEDLAGRPGRTDNTVINTILARSNQSKIRWAIGDEKANDLIAAIEHEQRMHNAPNGLIYNSMTQPRQEAAKFWTPQAGLLEGARLSDAPHGVVHGLGMGVKAGIRAVQSRMAAKAAAEAAKTREEVSRVLTLQGPERDAVARSLVGDEGPAGTVPPRGPPRPPSAGPLPQGPAGTLPEAPPAPGGAPLVRQVVNPGRTGRPTQTAPLRLGNEDAILQAGFDRAKGPTFYSALDQAVQSAKQEKASPEQWLGTLKNTPGVKPEEMEWLGLPDWLKQQKGPVSKQQISDYVKANNVDVQEVVHGNIPPRVQERLTATKNEFDTYSQELAQKYDLNPLQNLAMYGRIKNMDRAEVQKYEQLQSAWNKAKEAAEYGRTKFGSYQLPGGENYRELLLTLPEKGGRTVKDANGHPYDASSFHGSHWDEPNVLAHIRFNDRTIDGKKTLFLEEIQSDWHQQGKRKGYIDPQRVTTSETAEKAAQKNLTQTIMRSVPDNPQLAEHLGNGFMREAENASDSYFGDGAKVTDESRYAAYLQKHWPAESERNAVDHYIRAVAERMDARRAAHSGLPDAPFKTSWPELSLKRMIRYAAENGYDQVAWTPGKVQAERYDLSKQVDYLAYRKNNDGTFQVSAMLPGGHGHKLGDRLTTAELSDHVGKAVADKIAEGVGERANFGGGGTSQQDWWHTLKGENLRVGGEGMHGFYDKILPAAANKIVKKYGAKAGTGTLESPGEGAGHWFVEPRREPGTGRTVYAVRHTDGETHSVELTPTGATETAHRINAAAAHEQKTPVHTLPLTASLRRAAFTQGMPQFRRGGRIKRGFAEGGVAENSGRSRDNAKYVRGVPSTYQTDLGSWEPMFRAWVAQNKIPFDADAKGATDYDMRGFFRGLMDGDPRAVAAQDPNDARTHFPDTWKTPLHETFSAQSQYATPDAPQWNNADQLVDQNSGRIVYDDKRANDHDRVPGFAAGGRIGKPKLSHLAVGYITRSHLPGKHCAVCTMFQPDRGGPGCTLVRDPITPQGWCRRFTPKTKD